MLYDDIGIPTVNCRISCRKFFALSNQTLCYICRGWGGGGGGGGGKQERGFPDASISITENGTENTQITSHRQIILQIHRSQRFLFGHHRSQTIPLSQVTDLFSAFSQITDFIKAQSQVTEIPLALYASALEFPFYSQQPFN